MLYATIGEHKPALLQYTRCLVVHEHIFGKDHPSTATSYMNCGSSRMALGLIDRALEQFRKALAIRRDNFGKFHYKVADIHVWMGDLYFTQKSDYQAAVAEFRKALEIFMQCTGPEHIETASTRQKLGQALFRDDDLDGALNEYHECLRVYAILAANSTHPQKANICPYIGTILERQKDYDGAEAMVREA